MNELPAVSIYTILRMNLETFRVLFSIIPVYALEFATS